MATAVAKGNAGVCTTDATSESVSRTEGGAGNTDIRTLELWYQLPKT